MLVRFISSETGELIMFAEVAHQLLTAMGKECTARGTFTVEEMLPAAEALKSAVQRSQAPPPSQMEAEVPEKEKPVALGQRAWPLIDMLERTARGRKHPHIIWEAPQDF